MHRNDYTGAAAAGHYTAGAVERPAFNGCCVVAQTTQGSRLAYGVVSATVAGSDDHFTRGRAISAGCLGRSINLQVERGRIGRHDDLLDLELARIILNHHAVREIGIELP